MDDYLYDSDTYLQSDLFAGIAKEKQADIVNAGEHRLVASEATLFREGHQALRCFFVRKGRLKLSKTHEEGKEVIIRYINPGEITAAVAVFSGKSYPVTAAAVGPTDVVGWDRETMLDLMSAHPPWRALTKAADQRQPGSGSAAPTVSSPSEFSVPNILFAPEQRRNAVHHVYFNN